MFFLVDFVSVWKNPKLRRTYRHHLSLVIAENNGVGEFSISTEGVAVKRYFIEFQLVASDRWLQYVDVTSLLFLASLTSCT